MWNTQQSWLIPKIALIVLKILNAVSVRVQITASNLTVSYRKALKPRDAKVS